MTITTSSLVTRCETRFGDTGHAIVSAADWLQYLQDAYDDGNTYSPFWPWNELRKSDFSLAAGANTIALTSYGSRVLSVHNVTDMYPLTPLEAHATWRTQYPTTDQGSPVNYRMFAQTLEVYPIPDHAITVAVEYYGNPTALDTSSVNPVWPDAFCGALVDGALALAYLDDGNEKFAMDCKQKFDEAMVKMEETLLSGTRHETYPRVTDEFW